MEKSDFTSPGEEITYWKNLAKDFKLSLSDARVELDDYQASSRELEAELETQIDQLEAKNKDLIVSNSRLQQEVESLREKLEGQQDTYHNVTEELQSELAQVRAFKDELQRYIRELEQTNDDLERAKRATVVSLEDFEQRLNMAIERNAFLESELDEKESLAITVQRLKDEARDLRQELDVKVCDRSDSEEFLQRGVCSLPSSGTVDGIAQTDLANNDNEASRVMTYQNSSASASDPSSVTPPCTPSGKGLPPMTPGSSPLTTSARISALNIVGDLLRKVGALESKLASCRNFVKDQPGVARNGRIGAPSPLNSPRAKRLNRGVTAPSSLKVIT